MDAETTAIGAEEEAAAEASEDTLADEVLVDEISVDGMCGVY